MQHPTDSEKRQWEDEGYLVIEEAITGDELARLQMAHRRGFVEGRSKWRRSVAAGESLPTCFAMREPFLKDQVYLDLVDHPSYLPHVVEFLGPDLICGGIHVLTVPPWPVSYTHWHPDFAPDAPLRVKVHIYVDDVGADGAGGFGVVPGTHKQDPQPYRYHRELQNMPGCKIIDGKAGTAVIFDICGLHTAMPNRSGPPRHSLFMCYDCNEGQPRDSSRHAAIAHLCTTPERRRLLQLD